LSLKPQQVIQGMKSLGF